ncbi:MULTISPECIES: PRC and DUF2382 domain-containing protein [unclassified Rathayibacter]|uniref:DUF2382 domain-containing protein n=1 Tax=unclassified Rathayibacter TaxID=2609250 RepID=UPI0010480E54|nr:MULTISPECIES: PRC and DUF2382 domain-containing protein [unclassified Rathayibacter]TCL77940.1 uncharacterized protein (TIGR02271 family) [Rathayibacter sp. PhB192]TCM23715.1 uncharacterized protein (TIGR02271 family) [Rathayibacter sp. PhB179]
MIDSSNINDLIGADVRGTDDSKIGTVGQIYIADDSQTPTWVTIRTGLFGSGESFAPLEDATFEGGVLRVGYEKAFVKDAPRVDDDGALSADEEQTLYNYYGRGDSYATPTEAPLYDQDADRTADTDRTQNTAGTEGYDTSGPTTDDAMTRSEERLRVGTEKVEAGRARLRKHIVTEQVTKTVPVSHDEVRVTREAITDANVGDALSGPELSEEEHEVILTGERVVTAKETVPVERVSLGTETVTEQQQVTEDVSHEEIELVDPTTTTSDESIVDRDTRS